MVKLIKSIKIKPSFWAALIFMLFAGFGKLYGQAAAFAFFHEMCHIIAAKRLGLKTGTVYITPIGCNAVIKDFYSICCFKRCIVLIAGPLFNFAVFITAFFLKKHTLMYVNAALFLCNLIPAVPFDGGRILKNIGGEIIGILKMERISCCASKALSVIIMLIGILQLIFYNYNVSILCLGFYILKESRQESVVSIYSFYKAIVKNRNISGIYKTKTVVLQKDAFLWECVREMTADKVLLVYICENGAIKDTLTQWQVADIIEQKGVFCKYK